MAKKVIITSQDVVDGKAHNKEKEVIVDDSFDLREDYFDYLTGTKTDPQGNAVMGAMIGENNYFRFSDVIDIQVVEEN